jgi:hypothetical protein
MGSNAHVWLYSSGFPVVDLSAVLNIAGLLGNKSFSGQSDHRTESEGGATCYLKMPFEFVQ